MRASTAIDALLRTLRGLLRRLLRTFGALALHEIALSLTLIVVSL